MRPHMGRYDWLSYRERVTVKKGEKKPKTNVKEIKKIAPLVKQLKEEAGLRTTQLVMKDAMAIIAADPPPDWNVELDHD